VSVQTTGTPHTLYILSVCQAQLQGHLGDVGNLASDEEKMWENARKNLWGPSAAVYSILQSVKDDDQGNLARRYVVMYAVRGEKNTQEWT
jgi:hypothetical protein